MRSIWVLIGICQGLATLEPSGAWGTTSTEQRTTYNNVAASHQNYAPTGSDIRIKSKRELITEYHGEYDNFWYKMAHYTTKTVNITESCWVCTFKPHHAGENPTTIPVPLPLWNTFCLLLTNTMILSKATRYMQNFSMCANYTRALKKENWIYPDNWTNATNITVHKGMAFMRNPTPAPVAFYKKCEAGDKNLGHLKSESLIVVPGMNTANFPYNMTTEPKYRNQTS